MDNRTKKQFHPKLSHLDNSRFIITSACMYTLIKMYTMLIKMNLERETMANIKQLDRWRYKS